MKIRMEIDEVLQEDEIIIRCRTLDDTIQSLQAAISAHLAGTGTNSVDSLRYLTLKRADTDYFIPIEEILFFETEDKCVYAHTKEQSFQTEFKLYELEEMLSGNFMRISKAALVNLNHIYSITRNITASSVIEFQGTAKNVYVSRHYYKALLERLTERWRKL